MPRQIVVGRLASSRPVPGSPTWDKSAYFWLLTFVSIGGFTASPAVGQAPPPSQDQVLIGVPVEKRIELWSEGESLVQSRKLVELKNAPIQKDGRIAFLETIFAFSVAEN